MRIPDGHVDEATLEAMTDDAVLETVHRLLLGQPVREGDRVDRGAVVAVLVNALLRHARIGGAVRCGVHLHAPQLRLFRLRFDDARPQFFPEAVLSDTLRVDAAPATLVFVGARCPRVLRLNHAGALTCVFVGGAPDLIDLTGASAEEACVVAPSVVRVHGGRLPRRPPARLWIDGDGEVGAPADGRLELDTVRSLRLGRVRFVDNRIRFAHVDRLDLPADGPLIDHDRRFPAVERVILRHDGDEPVVRRLGLPPTTRLVRLVGRIRLATMPPVALPSVEVLVLGREAVPPEADALRRWFPRLRVVLLEEGFSQRWQPGLEGVEIKRLGDTRAP